MHADLNAVDAQWLLKHNNYITLEDDYLYITWLYYRTWLNNMPIQHKYTTYLSLCDITIHTTLSTMHAGLNAVDAQWLLQLNNYATLEDDYLYITWLYYRTWLNNMSIQHDYTICLSIHDITIHTTLLSAHAELNAQWLLQHSNYITLEDDYLYITCLYYTTWLNNMPITIWHDSTLHSLVCARRAQCCRCSMATAEHAYTIQYD